MFKSLILSRTKNMVMIELKNPENIHPKKIH